MKKIPSLVVLFMLMLVWPVSADAVSIKTVSGSIIYARFYSKESEVELVVYDRNDPVFSYRILSQKNPPPKLVHIIKKLRPDLEISIDYTLDLSVAGQLHKIQKITTKSGKILYQSTSTDNKTGSWRKPAFYSNISIQIPALWRI